MIIRSEKCIMNEKIGRYKCFIPGNSYSRYSYLYVNYKIALINSCSIYLGKDMF